MTRLLHNFLKDEEHASIMLITGCVTIMAIGLIVAVCAIFLMN
jgi:hypothetical protein